MITGPQQIASLAEAPLSVEQANFRALDNRMWSSLNAPRSQGKLEAWAAYDYSHTDQQAGPNNGSAHMNTIAVGGDMKVSDRMLVGAMFGYTDNKGDFAGAGGGYTLRQPVGTVYAGYGDGPWYIGATLGAGSLDYSDITRVIPLGAALRTESAEARGYELTGRILGGYWFPMKDLMHGPYARLAWEKAVVKDFSEMSSDSTALTYDRQTRKQLLWSLGWQVAGQHRRDSSLCASYVGDRFQGSGPQHRRVVRHAGRQLQHPGREARQQLRAVQPGRQHRVRKRYRIHRRVGHREPGGWQLLGDHRRPPDAAVAPGTSERVPAGGGPLNRIAAACAARARTARRKAGAAAFAARTRRSPWATAAHRIACGARSRARCGARPRPHSARTASDRDFSPSSAC